jgi:hypothetical protein
VTSSVDLVACSLTTAPPTITRPRVRTYMFVVYWLHDAEHESPHTDGYIGITGRLATRVRQHRGRKDGIGREHPEFQVTVLFKGTRKECQIMEYDLRPRPGIGWNISLGGNRGPPIGHYTCTEETKAKLRARRLAQVPPPTRWGKGGKKPKPGRTRYCRVCGQPFPAVRFDALTCSVTCRSRLHRDHGLDLAYLVDWPAAAAASARRAVHESIIAIARMVAASLREGRAQRRGLPEVRYMKVRMAARAS